MSRYFYLVARGRVAGTVLSPHRYADGQFVVSKTRFESDQLRVAEDEIGLYVAQGYGLRMSNPSVPSHRSPSLIAARVIQRSAGASLAA